MPRQIIRTFGLDRDTIAFAQRVRVGSGTTILPNNLIQLNKFVVGIKRMGLWNQMVCWPMRSTQNAGRGSTVYSLGGLGTFNGTLINATMWDQRGIIGSTINSYLAVNNFSLGSTIPSALMVYNRINPSESTRPYLQSAISFGMNWFSQARTYMWGYDSTNTQRTAYTSQNGFWLAPNFNSLSIEIAGVGAPVSQPFYVFENNTFHGNLVAPSAPFDSRQNFVEQLQLYYGTQQVPFLLFINGRNAQSVRSLFRQTLGMGLNMS
jgi:hypothetical protein